MTTKPPTDNSHKLKEYRLGVKPDMSTMLSHYNSHSAEISKQRYLERYVPALSSKTLIYPQDRIISPPNRYGTRMIRFIDPTVHYRPAGIDGMNSTMATGSSFTYQKQVSYPQNVSFI